jgi:argininosuccinate synthase
VLAFSGRPGAAAAVRSLVARSAGEVVTVTVDLGQASDLEQIAADARAAGAVRAHVVDGREAFAATVVLPALRAGAASAMSGVMVAALGRAAVAKALVDVAGMEGTTVVAHGATGSDRVAMDLLLSDAGPGLSVIDVAGAAADLALVPRVASNLWARTVLVPAAADPSDTEPSVLYQRTSQPAAGEGPPALVEISFEQGLPAAVNGIAMPFVEMVEVVDTIAGDHGVGRIEWVDAGTGHRRIIESPAAVTLGTALAELERAALPPRLLEIKRGLARAYALVIEDGAWFSPTRRALDAFVEAAAAHVTGRVRVVLSGGDCRIEETSISGAAAVAATNEPAG